QISEDVHAVDAAVGPEVEEDDLAAQLANAEWALGVEPLEALGKLRGVYFASVLHLEDPSVFVSVPWLLSRRLILPLRHCTQPNAFAGGTRRMYSHGEALIG